MENKDISVLLVDDEVDILEFLGYNLANEGFKILKASNGQMALDIAKEKKPNLIILDVMMPGLDGIETCSQLRLIPDLNDSLIVFLTARGEDYSQIAGFEAGADDYILKPIKPKVLTSRLQALLRRFNATPEITGKIKTGEFLVDLERYVVVKNGEEIFFTHKEFELLRLIVSHPNKIITREDILNQLWGGAVMISDRTLNVHIHRIRDKIGTDNIKTIKGVGYQYVEELVNVA